MFGVDNIKQLEEYIALRDSTIPTKMIDEIDKVFETVEEKLVNPVLWR